MSEVGGAERAGFDAWGGVRTVRHGSVFARAVVLAGVARA